MKIIIYGIVALQHIWKNNMKPTWIIENLVKEGSFLELSEAVKRAGYPLIEIKGDYNKSIFKDLNTLELSGIIGYRNKPVIFNGCIKMAKLVREDLNSYCRPVLYSNFEKFKCSSYYSHFGPYLFNDKYCLMSLREVVRQKFSIWGTYGKESLIFIRPDSGEKTFQAGLLDIMDLATLHESNKDCEHDLMMVSTPKNIKWEGRFIVSREKKIIAHSTYRFQGLVTKIPAVPEGATKFVKELFKVNYYPDSIFCYDICEDNDENFWLMELTSFSSAGLYASNKDNIVKEVSKIVLDDYNKI